MKIFIEAKQKFSDELIKGHYYELIGKIKSSKFDSGKGVLVVTDSGRFNAFDSSFFE